MLKIQAQRQKMDSRYIVNIGSKVFGDLIRGTKKKKVKSELDILFLGKTSFLVIYKLYVCVCVCVCVYNF